jgi:hypothetical protein
VVKDASGQGTVGRSISKFLALVTHYASSLVTLMALQRSERFERDLLGAGRSLCGRIHTLVFAATPELVRSMTHCHSDGAFQRTSGSGSEDVASVYGHSVGSTGVTKCAAVGHSDIGQRLHFFRSDHPI